MRRSQQERFWAKVDKNGPDGCWLWTGGLTGPGYGMFRLGGVGTKVVYVHRFAYEWCVGPIPDGLQIDHLCRVRHCVNPAHLEMVTQRVNILRGRGFQEFQRSKTHCPQDHEYTPDNTYVWRGTRRCRTCVRAYRRRKAS